MHRANSFAEGKKGGKTFFAKELRRPYQQENLGGFPVGGNALLVENCTKKEKGAFNHNYGGESPDGNAKMPLMKDFKVVTGRVKERPDRLPGTAK